MRKDRAQRVVLASITALLFAACGRAPDVAHRDGVRPLTVVEVGGGEASISGTKFHDLNASGVWDAGEPGTDGLTIRLYRDSNADGVLTADDTKVAENVIDTTDGQYSFTKVPSGTYFVCEAKTSTWVQSFPSKAENQICGAISDLQPNGYKVVLSGDQCPKGLDFGNWLYAASHGDKYLDVNNNAKIDIGIDTPIEGITFRLYEYQDPMPPGAQPLKTFTTGPTGHFSFWDLLPGKTYLVCEEIKPGLILAYPNGNSLCAFDAALEPAGFSFTAISGKNHPVDFLNASEISGCTPGYWKNHTDRWPAEITAGDKIEDAASDPFKWFHGAGTTLGAKTLLEALQFTGGSGVDGGKKILLRAAVASLLNFLHPDVNYLVPAKGSLAAISSSATLRAAVDAALTSGDRNAMIKLGEQLDAANNAVNSCPLTGTRAYKEIPTR